MEEIVIHCPTEYIFLKVLTEMDKKGIDTKGSEKAFNYYGEKLCLRVENNTAFYGPVGHYKNGYTIIPASEYLKEGGDMFKVGDRVEVIKNYDNAKKGMKGIIKALPDDDFGYAIEFSEVFSGAHDCCGKCEETKGQYVLGEYLRIIEKSKENNIKENNINKNVLEVFGDLSAKEVVIIDRHFTDEMLKVIMMKKFFKEIKAACMEAEEKLKENID